MEFNFPLNLFALSCISKAKSCNERKGMQDFKTISPIAYTSSAEITQRDILGMIEMHLAGLGMAAIYGEDTYSSSEESAGRRMNGIVNQGEKGPIIDPFISGYIIPQAYFEYYKDNLLKVRIISTDFEPKLYAVSITTIARVVLDKKD